MDCWRLIFVTVIINKTTVHKFRNNRGGKLHVARRFSFLNLMICCFSVSFLTVTDESLGFGLLLRQKKHFKEINLNSGKLSRALDNPLLQLCPCKCKSEVRSNGASLFKTCCVTRCFRVDCGNKAHSDQAESAASRVTSVTSDTQTNISLPPLTLSHARRRNKCSVSRKTLGFASAWC